MSEKDMRLYMFCLTPSGHGFLCAGGVVDSFITNKVVQLPMCCRYVISPRGFLIKLFLMST